MRLQTDAQILKGARLAIFNTEKDAEQQKRMAIYGFPAKRIQEGKLLLENANSLKERMTNTYEDGWQISQQLEADLQAIKSSFMDHVVLARAIFRKNPVVLHSLKIRRISKNKWDWTTQAEHFYTKLEAHVAQLKPLGITQAIIEQAKASVQSLIEMKEDRYQLKGKAEDSTQVKREALKALKEWLKEFRGAARLAFKDNPQILEAYGILVSSKV